MINALEVCINLVLSNSGRDVLLIKGKLMWTSCLCLMCVSYMMLMLDDYYIHCIYAQCTWIII